MRFSARSAGARVCARPPRASLRARLRERAKNEQGFTIVEVLVATVVLAIGLLTAYLALVVSVHSSSTVRQREEGVSLARQVTEDARSIPYSQLSNTTIVTLLQAMPGLANTSSGSSWTVSRGGYKYTISATLTDLNDPKDTSGGTDVKQFSVTVSWSTFQAQSHQFTETAIMSRAGEDPGLAASNLELSSPAWGTAGLSGSVTAPVISSTGITSLTFSVTAPAGTTAVVWTLNGVKQSSWAGSAPTSGTTWTSSAWSLSGVSDTTYTVGAQAEDSSGVDGPGVTIPVRLIRNVPSAPNVTGYGFNTNLMTSSGRATAAEIEWTPNPERNVVGYRIYSPVNNYSTPICQLSTASSYPVSCSINPGGPYCTTLTSCIDLSPPAVNAGNLTYKVVALYYDINNNLQEGTVRSVTLTSGTPTPPGAATGLTVTPQLDGTAILTWVPPVGGTPVSFYRIYRDGNTYQGRYDTLSASSCSATCTYHDTSRSTAHEYWVTAVGGTTPGSDMAESTQDGPASG